MTENHSFADSLLTLTTLSVSNATSSLNKTNGANHVKIETIELVILYLLFFPIIAGNLSVLIALGFRNMRNQMRLFIMNLALTDLMVAVGGMLPEIVGRLTAFEYTSDPLCKMVKYVSTAITYSSSFALIVLSIDRAEAVCRPFRAASHGMSNKTQAHLMIAVAWILAGLCGLPGLLMGYMQPDGKYKGVCMLSFARIRPQIYFTCIFVSVFLVPAVLITVCHVVMVVTIWRAPKLQAASFDGYPNHRVTVTDERCSVSSIEHGDVSRRSRAILRRSILRRASASKGFPNKPSDMKRPKPGSISRAKVKTVKMTCVIVSAYIVCWCPFMVWNLLVTYNVIQRAARHLMQYTPLIQHLVPLNSAANPIIFWIFSAGSVRRKRNARIIIHAQRGQHTNN